MEEHNKSREEVLTNLDVEPIEIEKGLYDIAPEREEVTNE